MMPHRCRRIAILCVYLAGVSLAEAPFCGARSSAEKAYNTLCRLIVSSHSTVTVPDQERHFEGYTKDMSLFFYRTNYVDSHPLFGSGTWSLW